MTQEDKELLLKDLCARLPYGVKCDVGEKAPYTLSRIEIDNVDGHLLDLSEMKDGLYMQAFLSGAKPYLFPLSSMTEEQYNEFFSYYHNLEMAEVKSSGDYLKAAYIGDDAKYSWLNSHHFDYRGLIERGLAIDATGLNIY